MDRPPKGLHLYQDETDMDRRPYLFANYVNY